MIRAGEHLPSYDALPAYMFVAALLLRRPDGMVADTDTIPNSFSRDFVPTGSTVATVHVNNLLYSMALL